MPQVKCIKCNRIGNLTIKKTKSHGTTYEYYYVQHYLKETNKIEWCYLGRYDSLPEEYRRTLPKEEAVHNKTQNCTQNSTNPNNLKFSLNDENSLEQKCLGSLAWWGTALVRRRSRVQFPPEAPFQSVKMPENSIAGIEELGIAWSQIK